MVKKLINLFCLSKRMVCFVAVWILVLANALTAFAYNLPDGTVQGLPKNLVVMDENGHSPDSGNGELYIYIENMVPEEVYTKDISISNLRDDAVYTVRMRATPNYTKGNIDLINEVDCKLYLDDVLIYQGRVDGDGTPNMQTNGIKLGGAYGVNESRNLHAEFVWNMTEETSNLMATYYGEDSGYYGEISFNWIFDAEVPVEARPTSETTGGGTGGTTGTKTNGRGTNIAAVPRDTTSDSPSGDRAEPLLPVEPNDSDSVDNTDTSTGENPNPDLTEPEPEGEKTKHTYGKVDKLITDVVSKLPFIPDDVKTGYHSEILLYTKVFAVAIVFAVGILIAIGVKSRKLKKLKCLGG